MQQKRHVKTAYFNGFWLPSTAKIAMIQQHMFNIEKIPLARSLTMSLMKAIRQNVKFILDREIL